MNYNRRQKISACELTAIIDNLKIRVGDSYTYHNVIDHNGDTFTVKISKSRWGSLVIEEK